MTCKRAGRKKLWTLLVLVNVAVILSWLNTDHFQFRYLNSEETYKALYFVFYLLEGLGDKSLAQLFKQARHVGCNNNIYDCKITQTKKIYRRALYRRTSLFCFVLFYFDLYLSP